MPKIKTRNAVAKRFKITKNGKVKHTQEGRRHKLVKANKTTKRKSCLLYTSPSPRDLSTSRMPSSA